MAALQKIRSKGVLLVTIIAVALFLFVAGDLFRGLESLFQKSSQQVGEVDGKSISIQEYQNQSALWRSSEHSFSQSSPSSYGTARSSGFRSDADANSSKSR